MTTMVIKMVAKRNGPLHAPATRAASGAGPPGPPSSRGVRRPAGQLVQQLSGVGRPHALQHGDGPQRSQRLGRRDRVGQPFFELLQPFDGLGRHPRRVLPQIRQDGRAHLFQPPAGRLAGGKGGTVEVGDPLANLAGVDGLGRPEPARRNATTSAAGASDSFHPDAYALRASAPARSSHHARISGSPCCSARGGGGNAVRSQTRAVPSWIGVITARSPGRTFTSQTGWSPK